MSRANLAMTGLWRRCLAVGLAWAIVAVTVLGWHPPPAVDPVAPSSLGTVGTAYADDRPPAVGDDQILEDIVFRVSSRVQVNDNEFRIYNAGQSSRRMIRRGDRIHVSEQSRLKIETHFGPIEIHSDSSLVEDLDGKLLEFDYLDAKKQLSGQLIDGRMLVTRREGQTVTQFRVNMPRETRTENGNVRKMLREYPARSARETQPRWTLPEFTHHEEDKLSRSLKFTIETADDPITFANQTVRTFRFHQVEARPDDDDFRNELKFWVDRRGVLYRLENNLMNNATVITYERVR